MKNRTGSPVRKEDFYDRKKLVANAWDMLHRGSSILIAAPAG